MPTPTPTPKTTSIIPPPEGGNPYDGYGILAPKVRLLVVETDSARLVLSPEVIKSLAMTVTTRASGTGHLTLDFELADAFAATCWEQPPEPEPEEGQSAERWLSMEERAARVSRLSTEPDSCWTDEDVAQAALNYQARGMTDQLVREAERRIADDEPREAPLFPLTHSDNVEA